jgi:quinol monooxygenase YgiN
MSVTRINEFRARAGRGDSLRTQLLAYVPIIESLEGCLSCQVLQSQKNPEYIVTIEVWDSIETHLVALLDTPAGDLEETLKLLETPPTGDYFDYCHA